MTLLVKRTLSAVIALSAVALGVANVNAGGHNNPFRNNAVGGISVDANGVVSQMVPVDAKRFREHVDQFLDPAPTEMTAPTELRKISLRTLEEALATSRKANYADIPEEVRYLAGIQRIRYVFVYPEKNDIVIAGPGEGWRTDEAGNVVGITTGRPVMRIDDFATAFRTVDSGREQGISCSIEPTDEGRRNFQQFMARQTTFNPAVVRGIEQALGPQQVLLTGVPNDSRFARMMVAADVQMKRLAMKLEKSPLQALPSYLDLVGNARAAKTNMTPRWWLACNYEPIGRSDDGLAYEIRGPGVKCLTEDDFIAADGTVERTGQTNPLAQRWADAMTYNYDQLCGVQPVFGELRNLMDMSVVAALVQRERLLEKANLNVELLAGQQSDLKFLNYYAPKRIATQASFIKVGRQYVITASGGVQIESWDVAGKQTVDAAIGNIRDQAAPSGKSLWWN